MSQEERDAAEMPLDLSMTRQGHLAAAAASIPLAKRRKLWRPYPLAEETGERNLTEHRPSQPPLLGPDPEWQPPPPPGPPPRSPTPPPPPPLPSTEPSSPQPPPGPVPHTPSPPPPPPPEPSPRTPSPLSAQASMDSEEDWSLHLSPESTASPSADSRQPTLVPYTDSEDTSQEQVPSPETSQTGNSDSSPAPNQISDFDPSDYYDLEWRDPINFIHGQVTQHHFRINITRDVAEAAEDEGGGAVERMARIQALLFHAFHRVFAQLPTKTIAQVFIENRNMHNQVRPTRRCRIEDMSFDDVANQLVKIEQSSKDGEEDEQVRLEDTWFTAVTYLSKAKTQVGGRIPTGLKARNEASMAHYVRSSQSFADPMAKSNRIPEDAQGLCIPLCIVMAQKRIQLNWRPRDETDPDRAKKMVEFRNYCRSREMRDDARALVAESRLSPASGPFTVEQIGSIQRLGLGPDYQVKVFSADRPPIASFGDKRAQHTINLLIREDLVPNPTEGKAHAVLILTMSGFMGKQRNYCHLCDKTFHFRTVHRCQEAGCQHCQLDICKNREYCSGTELVRPFATCKGCNRTYMTQACFTAHKKAKVCDKWKRCHLCRKVVKKKSKEPGNKAMQEDEDVEEEEEEAEEEEEDKRCGPMCGTRRCKHCKKEHFASEYCFVRPMAGKVSPNHPGNVKENAGAGRKPGAQEASVDVEEETEKAENSCDDDDDDTSSLSSETSGSQPEEPQAGSQRLDPPASLEELLGKKKLWYADAETFVDEKTQDHTANLLILQQPCYDTGPEEYKRRIYKGPTAMRLFVEDCMKLNSEYSACTIVFHNASGFDAHLWQRELLLLDSPPKNPIYKGERILTFTMQQNNIRVIDSLQFVPNTPLSKFPVMFNLRCGPKGEFPHHLNTPKWVDLVGDPDKVYQETDEEGTVHRFPLLKYFHPENKRPKELEKLKRWHADQVKRFEEDPSLHYKPAQELEAYCDQDVSILRQGCEVMRGSWLKQFPDMELFDFLTFPSFNNALYRTKYMAKDSIVLLSPEGFHRRNRKYSQQAMAWLSLVRAERKREGRELVEFRHARSGYEVSIAGFHVDGWGRDAQGNQHIFQYHGCFWHGCLDCAHKFTTLSEEQRVQQSIHRDNTRLASAFLRRLGENPESPYGPFKLHEIWTCQWKKMTGQPESGQEEDVQGDDGGQEEEEDELSRWRREYTEEYLINWVSSEDRLKPSDAFKGARTNVIQHEIAEVPDGFKLAYYDFTSLYPSVNFSSRGELWPLGHPDVYIGSEVEEAPPLDQAFGLWKVDVLPPRHLRHPVLGQTINNKLMFHLCTFCAKKNKQGYCKHKDRTRMMKKATFFTEELKLAVSKGYVIKRVYEVWDWTPERRTDDLFKDLIRDQYGKKVLASGAPSDPAELEDIIREHWVSMQLELLPEAFRKDPAMRCEP